MTNPHPILSRVPLTLLKRLPPFLINPDPSIYMDDNFVVFDIETTTKGDIPKGKKSGSPAPCWKQNSMVCASWTCGVDSTVYNMYGNELEMFNLVNVLEQADFIVAQFGKFDIGWMMRAGLDPHKIILYDTAIAEYCINGNRRTPLDLDSLATKYLGYGKEHFIDICMKGGVDPSEMPKSMLIDRCNRDVKQTRDLFLKQRRKIEQRGLLGHVYTRCLLSPALADIEAKGMCLDVEAVDELYNDRAMKLATATTEIDAFTGGINPRSWPQVKEYVYDILKFKPKMRGKGRYATPIYSTKTEDLLALKATTKKQKEFIRLKKNFSGYNADVGKNLLYFKGVTSDTRYKKPIFHAQFNQCITVTHRLSSSGIPRTFPHILDDEGRVITKSVQFQNFKSEFKRVMCSRHKGWSVGEADACQLEFRVAAFLGQCRIATQEIVDGVDVHKQSASIINNLPLNKITHELRRLAKRDTFKPLYGGKTGTPGQMAYYKWFAEHYTGISKAQQEWLDQALTTKKVRMLHGFTFYFPYCRLTPSGYIEQSTNICNYPVQHFATAEIIPIAVVYLWHLMKAMKSFLINTVHDSAIAELHPKEHKEFMECSKYAFTHLVYYYLKEVYNVEFNVPLGVSCKIGTNWGIGTELKCVPMSPYSMEGIDYTNLNTDWVED